MKIDLQAWLNMRRFQSMRDLISVVSLALQSTRTFKYLWSLANPLVSNWNINRTIWNNSIMKVQQIVTTRIYYMCRYFPTYNRYLDLYAYHIWCHTWWDSLRGNCIPLLFHLYLDYTKTQQILLLEKQFDPHKGMLCPHHRLLRTRNLFT